MCLSKRERDSRQAPMQTKLASVVLPCTPDSAHSDLLLRTGSRVMQGRSFNFRAARTGN